MATAPAQPAPAQLEHATEPQVRLHKKDSDQANICLGVPCYPLDHPDRYALQLLGTVLGTGMSSRLFLEVRERRGLAYYVYALNSSFTDAGTLASQAGVDLNRADEAVGVIADEFRKLADEAVPADELEKARALAKGRFVLQTESPNGLILFGLRREVLEGRAVEPEELLAGLDAVTAEDVQRVAQDVIGTNGMRLAVIGPFDDEDRFLTKLLEGRQVAFELLAVLRLADLDGACQLDVLLDGVPVARDAARAGERLVGEGEVPVAEPVLLARAGSSAPHGGGPARAGRRRSTTREISHALLARFAGLHSGATDQW